MADNNQWAVKYRPETIDDFLCHDYIRDQVMGFADQPPNAVLITGDLGNGKTTLAHIISKLLTTEASDIVEINGVTDSGVDNMRETVHSANFRPKGKRRVFIIDEAHELSAKAVQAVLKPMEDPKLPVTWIVCSNRPDKLNGPMMSRCRNLVLTLPPAEQINELLTRIIKKEKVRSYPGYVAMEQHDATAAKKVLARLRKTSVAAANGSVRIAVANFESLCSIMRAKTQNAKAVMRKLKDAALLLHDAVSTRTPDEIIALVKDDPAAAAAALLNCRDISIFQKIMWAARDSIADGRKSELATRVFAFCVDAQQWAAFTALNPSQYLASKLAMWAVNKDYRDRQGAKKENK